MSQFYQVYGKLTRYFEKYVAIKDLRKKWRIMRKVLRPKIRYFNFSINSVVLCI